MSDIKGNGQRYWRSLDELADKPEFKQWLHREFPEGASEMLESGSRRTLLKLMAASFGLAGLTACSRPVQHILPQSKGVEDYVPGNPRFYSTVMTLGGVAHGLVVEAHDGRPTKIEGNPRHPSSLGAASAYAQASVLDLYDPDRSQAVLHGGNRSDWDEFEAFAREHFTTDNLGDGGGVRILSEPSGSPSLGAVRDRFLGKFPAAQWVTYSSISRDAELDGAEIAFGRRLQPRYNLEKADVILSLDSDFLGVDAPSLAEVRQFARRRQIESERDEPNRLYVVEPGFTVTGAAADHRFRALAGEVAGMAAAVARGEAPDTEWGGAVWRDLEAHRGRSLVIAGPRQAAEVHALVYLINETLGNLGQTIQFAEPAVGPAGHSIVDLASEIGSGQVSTLIVLGANPCYDAPGDLNFAALLDKVDTVIHHGMYADETAVAATWHLPGSHYLESWGDARALDGTASVQQPLIAPLYSTKTAAELLALLGDQADQRDYEIVRQYWMSQWGGGDNEKQWRRVLHDGVIEGTAFPVESVTLRRDAVLGAAAAVGGGAGPEVVFYPSPSVWDGRFVNNGWLQEMPDPMTKLTWDNAALLSPATAGEFDVTTGDVIRIVKDGRAVEAPVWVQPGQADGSIALELGYGRTAVGRVGEGAGFNPSPLRSAREMGFAGGIEVTRTGRRYDLSSAQEHSSMEGRALVREATLEHYREEPEFAEHAVHHLPLESLYENPPYTGQYQWGMAIDLNKCTGCNACVMACQAENNIPIVGKHEVARGREMHWIRLDRYFTGSEEDPQAVVQPVACHHCENAPCENVCPVAATSHSSEGLNMMTYNRCVGTRYCSNNCPYKVRRFNFLDWHHDLSETGKMVFNPDVTVRMRGVMEKCTYCVQRIEEKKIQANAEGRRTLKDGEIKTACQQTCASEAIAFGNIADPESKVSRIKAQNRNYAMLAELNIRPRTTYLARIRNPNPELGGGGDDRGGGHESSSLFPILNEAKGA